MIQTYMKVRRKSVKDTTDKNKNNTPWQKVSKMNWNTRVKAIASIAK